MLVCAPQDKARSGIFHLLAHHVVVCGDGPRKRLLTDFVGRYEVLAKDFTEVAAKMG